MVICDASPVVVLLVGNAVDPAFAKRPARAGAPPAGLVCFGEGCDKARSDLIELVLIGDGRLIAERGEAGERP